MFTIFQSDAFAPVRSFSASMALTLTYGSCFTLANDVILGKVEKAYFLKLASIILSKEVVSWTCTLLDLISKFKQIISNDPNLKISLMII